MRLSEGWPAMQLKVSQRQQEVQKSRLVFASCGWEEMHVCLLVGGSLPPA
jgi:hypothetical protein